MTDKQIATLITLMGDPAYMVFWLDPRGGYRLLSGEVVDGQDEKIAYLSGTANRAHIDLFNCGCDDILVALVASIDWETE